MCEIIGYLDYKKDVSKNILKKILDKLIFKIELNKFDDNKVELLINSDELNEKRIKKIKKVIIDNAIKILVLSNKFNDIDEIKDENIKILNGKFLMKNIIINILEYIYNCQNKDMRFEEVYLAINNDKQKEILFDLAKNVRSINIVTDKIKKFKRLDKKLENEEEIIYSISNNTKKSLKRAKTIINFDYDSDFFDKFNVNRNAIIINLNDEKLNLKNSFHGIVIENVTIEYKRNENNILKMQDFNKNLLYESYIYNLNYYEIKERYIYDDCKICNLIGKNSIISNDELKIVN